MIYDQCIEYYRELESEFLSVERYVAIDELNFSAYSVKFSLLLQSITSEVDSVFSILGNGIGVHVGDAINEYYRMVKDYCPTIIDDTIMVNRNDILLKPFSNWSLNKSPAWWKANNTLKHHRNEIDKEDGLLNYKKANLGNVINALAALYLLENYIIIISENNPDSGAQKMIDARGNLFVCKDWKHYYQSYLGQKFFSYKDFIPWIRQQGLRYQIKARNRSIMTSTHGFKCMMLQAML